MDVIAALKKILYGLLGLGVVGGLLYVGAGTYPTTTPTVVAFPVNPELTDFYTAGCDVQVLTNQNRSLNSVEYLINTTQMTGDPSAFSYSSMNVSSNDWSRWSGGALQNTSYWCYIHVAQNELSGALTNYYFNFTRNASSNLIGNVTWNSGAYNGTYNYRSLTITGPITLNSNTTLNILESLTITGTGQITITAANPVYTLNISTYSFVDNGLVLGTGYTGTTSYTGGKGATIIINAATINGTGSLISNGGAGGSGSVSCGSCGGSGGGQTPGTAGGEGGIINITGKPIISGALYISTLGGVGANPVTCCLFCGYGGACNAWASGSSAGGIGGKVSLNALNASLGNQVIVNGGAGGAAQGSFWCGPGSPGYCSSIARAASAGGNGGTGIYNVSSNITVTSAQQAIGGSGSPNGANGVWNVSYCANGTGMDWTKFTPTATTSAAICLAPPTTSFLAPNSTTSLLTLSNNLTATLSTSATELSYRYQISLNNGSTWTYVTEAAAPAPSYFNNTTTFDVYLMNATPNALMRVLAFNNTSKIFGVWTNSQAFSLLTRNTMMVNTTSPSPIVSTPFTIYCNYTSNGTVLQDAAARVYIDGIPFNMTYAFATKLYGYTWSANTSIAAGNHTYYCWANKGNFNLSQSANVSFSIGGFAVYYAGGNGTRFFCPFPTYIKAYPAYQTAGKGAIRVQNFNTTNNKNYSVILRYPQPAGMVVYGRCDKLSPAATGWTVLTDAASWQCWTGINSTNTSAYLWLKGDCIGATPDSYTVPEIVVIEQ